MNFPALSRIKADRGIISFRLPESMVDTVEAFFQRYDEKHNYYYTVKISPPRKPRTTGNKSQNHRLNGFIQQIAIATGQPFDDIKKRAKQIAVDMGYPMLTDNNGKPIYDVWGNVQGISEADSSTAECALLINAVEQIAAFLDVRLIEGDNV